MNGSNLTEAQVESILGTAARLLVRETKMFAASVLANGGGRIVHWKHHIGTAASCLEVPPGSPRRGLLRPR